MANKYLKKEHGFTLIELMVAVGLMALIMLVVALIFKQTAKITVDSEDRMIIYLNARKSLDQLEVDLLGCLPLDINLQKFTLADGEYLENLSDIQTESFASGSTGLDRLTLRTFTSAGGTFQGVEITYVLGKEKDPTILAETGGSGLTLKTKRQLYALYRIPKAINKDGTTGPLVEDPQIETGEEEAAMALCHYVMSFNLEYFDTTRKQFRQIPDHLTDSPPKDVFEWPIGDANPPEEQLHRGIRAVLRVVANAAERQERIFPRAIWIPVGY